MNTPNDDEKLENSDNSSNKSARFAHTGSRVPVLLSIFVTSWLLIFLISVFIESRSYKNENTRFTYGNVKKDKSFSFQDFFSSASGIGKIEANGKNEQTIFAKAERVLSKLMGQEEKKVIAAKPAKKKARKAKSQNTKNYDYSSYQDYQYEQGYENYDSSYYGGGYNSNSTQISGRNYALDVDAAKDENIPEDDCIVAEEYIPEEEEAFTSKPEKSNYQRGKKVVLDNTNSNANFGSVALSGKSSARNERSSSEAASFGSNKRGVENSPLQSMKNADMRSADLGDNGSGMLAGIKSIVDLIKGKKNSSTEVSKAAEEKASEESASESISGGDNSASSYNEGSLSSGGFTSFFGSGGASFSSNSSASSVSKAAKNAGNSSKETYSPSAQDSAQEEDSSIADTSHESAPSYSAFSLQGLSKPNNVLVAKNSTLAAKAKPSTKQDMISKKAPARVNAAVADNASSSKKAANTVSNNADIDILADFKPTRFEPEELKLAINSLRNRHDHSERIVDVNKLPENGLDKNNNACGTGAAIDIFSNATVMYAKTELKYGASASEKSNWFYVFSGLYRIDNGPEAKYEDVFRLEKDDKGVFALLERITENGQVITSSPRRPATMLLNGCKTYNAVLPNVVVTGNKSTKTGMSARNKSEGFSNSAVNSTNVQKNKTAAGQNKNGGKKNSQNIGAKIKKGLAGW